MKARTANSHLFERCGVVENSAIEVFMLFMVELVNLEIVYPLMGSAKSGTTIRMGNKEAVLSSIVEKYSVDTSG